jgi:Ser/Thr protein kinase RdoA (MazF antagonist)
LPALLDAIPGCLVYFGRSEERASSVILKLTDGRAPMQLRDCEAWLTAVGSDSCVLKRYRSSFRDPSAPGHFDDVAWVHQLLSDLTALGSPVPRPLRIFYGASLTTYDGSIWDAVSYRPGEIIGWSASPSLTQVGRFIADLHESASALPPRPQRPIAFAARTLPDVLAEVRDRGSSAPAGVEMVDRALTDVLAELGSLCGTDVLPIHGDLTTHNVVCDPGSRAICGVIDFANAHVEDSIADLAYGLWRSGRRSQEGRSLDFRRVSSMVEGYRARRDIADSAVRAFPLFLRVRGLQMAVKQLWRGDPVRSLPQELGWIASHHDEIIRAIAGSTP